MIYIANILRIELFKYKKNQSVGFALLNFLTYDV